ncbi:MAG: hypothetical protein QHJ74_04365, partial [Anaerolineae bacterium]|nr:hypothetical protein [Anaerolineae bacterium]
VVQHREKATEVATTNPRGSQIFHVLNLLRRDWGVVGGFAPHPGVWGCPLLSPLAPALSQWERAGVGGG